MKRPLLSIEPLEGEVRAGEEAVVVLYARVPQSLADTLRDIAHERSKGRRKRATVNELIIEALYAYIEKAPS